MDSREIYCKEPLENTKLVEATVKALGVKEDDILIVMKSDDWLMRNDRPIVYEYKGKLDKDEDEYPEYYYYDIYFDIPILNKLKALKKELNIPDLLITE